MIAQVRELCCGWYAAAVRQRVNSSQYVRLEGLEEEKEEEEEKRGEDEDDVLA